MSESGWLVGKGDGATVVESNVEEGAGERRGVVEGGLKGVKRI